MNIQEQEEQLDIIISKMREIMLKKGNDYANQDRLSNFKLAGNISGISPEIQCLSLISTKVARLGTLLNSKNKPNNESIEDSVIDLINYSALLHMILSEYKSKGIRLNDYISDSTRDYWNFEKKEKVCNVCNGLGKLDKNECFRCDGEGTI